MNETSARPKRIVRRASARRALLAIVTGTMLASGCVVLETKERELTWRPIRSVAAWFAGLPREVQEVRVSVSKAADAPRIHGWWWPAASPSAPSILYLHGARWNLTGQLRRIEQLHDFGFSVLAIDYRGFGQSDGDLPSESLAYEDAAAAWRWLAAREPDARRRFIYGHSLGGAVAVDLAAKLSAGQGAGAAGLIVESSFTSLAEVAAAMSYQWLPVGLILSQKFDSVNKMAHVRVPVLIVHGANDAYVPARLSRSLFDAAPEPKKLLLVAGGSHNNSMWIGSREYRAAMTELFGLTPVPDETHVGRRTSPRGAPPRGGAQRG